MRFDDLGRDVLMKDAPHLEVSAVPIEEVATEALARNACANRLSERQSKHRRLVYDLPLNTASAEIARVDSILERRPISGE